MVEAIRRHTHHLRQAARDHFDEPIAACPGWTVADLVHHVTDVQWFWATIVSERLIREPPTQDDPRRPPDGLAQDAALPLLAEMSDLLITAVDGPEEHQATPVWTWAPDDQTVGFVTRHQVQEAAVHDFDASMAAGVEWTIDPVVAADCVEEFLTHSVCSPADPAPAGTEPLGGPVRLLATDTPSAWEVNDGSQPRTLDIVARSARWGQSGQDPSEETAAGDDRRLEATAGELLLWLYGRAEIGGVAADLVARFRALIWTT